MYQRSQYLAKHLAIAQLEKGDNGNDKCHLRPTKIQRSEWNAESFVAASKNLVNSLDVKDKVGIYCIKTGLFLTFHIQKKSFKNRDIHDNKIEDKSIKERLETRINISDPIKRSKLKIFESANKKIMVSSSDKTLI